ncbi:hypothetical protein HPP92_006090 [Vanilla planifolia]|uniref:WRKY domain-containing protein n=1 Tax=Vanilla planifolia TaxID=51239 RepID=A0A835RVT2_VANPL|nr:hypothetical protein HPP92_006090 [Vanilla planifolia]
MPEIPNTAVVDLVAGAARPEISAAVPGARYKAMSPAHLPIARSPCLTIPPGLSPTALLESPVLLTNVKAEPSPTTGTFVLPFIRNDMGSATLGSLKESSKSFAYEDTSTQSYGFSADIRSCSRPGLSSLAPSAFVGSSSKQQELSGKIESQFEKPEQSPSQLLKSENNDQPSEELDLLVIASDSPVEVSGINANVTTEDASNEFRQAMSVDCSVHVSQSDCSVSNPSTVVEKLAEDGYNWRKYGQKHVKGSEFPRSYYKCTHPNCQMKKQLERSHDGQITDIIYKGRHDHPKPQPSRRLAMGTVFMSHGEEKEDMFCSLENSQVEKFPNAHCHASYNVNPNFNSEFSPTSASGDETEVGGGHSGLIVGDIADDEDPESKRRKLEAATIEANSIAKTNREPRVVVQTVSEVDILDDGYRWRKYGQKVVKGNPNPRSYYKCTNPGCSVRKHVERASHDPKSVITTYEGKHNHDVPAARASSSHEESAPVITVGSTSLGNQLPVPPGNLPRTYGSHHYYQLEEKSNINLPLGVGVSLKDSRTFNDKQHIPVLEQVRSHQQPQYIGPDCNKVMPMLYGSSNRVVFGYSEEEGDGFTFTTQIDNSSNHYCPRPG